MTSALDKLNSINQKLTESPQLNRQQLLEMGVIATDTRPVHRAGTTASQSLPFTRLRLPFACTGILEPTKAVTDIHRAIQILLPGTGTTFSVAETLCDVAGTFHGRKSKNRGNARKEQSAATRGLLAPGNDFFRAASFPADLPLNGMGIDAPFEFASEAGLMSTVRHIHLVLSRLYPDRPVFIGGRSQGGITAILYGQHYADVAGVFAVNPPHPDPELFQYTIDYMEAKADKLTELLHAPGVSLHQRSWEGYKQFTPTFNYPERTSKRPTLILVSLGDTFNLFPKYAHMLGQFVDTNAQCTLHLFDAGHNLWDRKLTDTYAEVISIQTQFMLNSADIQY
jgi:hypothetical protein